MLLLPSEGRFLKYAIELIGQHGSWIRGGCSVATVRWPIEPPLGRAPLSAATGGDVPTGAAGPGPPRLQPRNDGARDGFWVYLDA